MSSHGLIVCPPTNLYLSQQAKYSSRTSVTAFLSVEGWDELLGDMATSHGVSLLLDKREAKLVFLQVTYLVFTCLLPAS